MRGAFVGAGRGGVERLEGVTGAERGLSTWPVLEVIAWYIQKTHI